MPIARDDPYGRFNFLVEIDGVTRAGLASARSRASGGETDVVAYREGGDRSNAFRLLPGLVRYPRVVLRRGFAGDAALFEWWQGVAAGGPDRRTVTITLLAERRDAVASWRVRRAWPAKYEGPALAARASEVAVEALELMHEGIELE